MKLFRIARQKYIRDISGSGARLYGGRWNHKGTPLLYTSSSASLAALELLVNTSIPTLPNDLQLMILSLPEGANAESIDIVKLQDNWHTWPAPKELADLGTHWAESKSSLLLDVPSAVIPLERNILVNPAHPHFENLEVESLQDFRFDNRLLR